MKKAYFYLLIKPVRKNIIDNNSNIGFEIEFQNDDIKMTLLQYEDGQPKSLRFEINNLSEEELPEKALDIIHTSKEHFLSIMRMNYDPNLEFLERPIWHFTEIDQGPVLNLSFGEELFPPDVEMMRNIFVNSFAHRNLMKLLTDGMNTRLPLKFRYLSLYKIIEFKFLKNGKWKTDELKAYLIPHQENLTSKNLKRPLFNLLHDIRDRSAHFRMNGNGLGISTLKRKDEMEINEIMDELTNIATSIVNNELQGKVTIHKRTNQDL